MADTTNLTFGRYDSAAARDQHGVVEMVYFDAFAEAIASGDPFESPEASRQRINTYLSIPNLDLVIAYLGHEPIGQAWGWPLGPDSSWWQGLIEQPEPGFTEETGTRTFAVSELMIRPAWTGQGYAHAIHDELLNARNEQRAVLLAEPVNERAYRAYLKWGWRPVAKLRPGWKDAPLFDVLAIDLPLQHHMTTQH